MPVRIAAVLASLLVLSSASLPATGPLPQARPEGTAGATPPGQAPKPETKPIAPQEKKNKENEVARPETGGQPPVPGIEESPAPEAEPAPVLTIEPESAADHAACLADLKKIGAIFREEKRIDDGKGCGIDKPIVLETVIPGVALKPEGTMRCATALALARWTKDAVLPAATVALPEAGPLTAINQASGYVCRLRNNGTTGKISEHARGNAVDIASFAFKSGETLAIQPRDEDGTLPGAFQRAVTAAGCLYFHTVLDPGSDAAHETHLHFDVLQRKNGYRYCR